jgi:hypothetical protein
MIERARPAFVTDSGEAHGAGAGALSGSAVAASSRPEAMCPDTLALFDLDGTITRRDTYLAYLLGFLARHPERWPRATPLPLAVLGYLLGVRDNTWLKTTFLRAILGGAPRSLLASWTEIFLNQMLDSGLRPGRSRRSSATGPPAIAWSWSPPASTFTPSR